MNPCAVSNCLVERIYCKISNLFSSNIMENVQNLFLTDSRLYALAMCVGKSGFVTNSFKEIGKHIK